MRIDKLNGKEERRILIGMIVDSVVCSRISSQWERNMFKSKWTNIVGELCVSYYKKFDAAPGKNIQSLFESWSADKKDEETIKLVGSFLSGLSSEYEQTKELENNSLYLIDLASKHFTRVKAKRALEKMSEEIDSENVETVVDIFKSFSPVEMKSAGRLSVFHDKKIIVDAFADGEETLIELPGALGRFFDRSLQREGFISFLGPEKRGKTAWLVYMAYQSMLQRRKVAFFSVGDESQNEMMRRFGTLVAKNPLHSGSQNIPYKITIEDKKPIIEYNTVNFEKGLSARMVYRAFRAVSKERLKTTKDYLCLSMHASGSLSVAGIDSQLKLWQSEGFTPDIIFVDYMDLLQESGTSRDDMRHRINATWRDFRGLLQRWHALGITATQANTKGAQAKIITKAHFSEDKRKLAHVTGMVGLNQTDGEKRKGIMRLNWVIGRGFYYYTPKPAWCAGCLGIANPAIKCVY